MVPGATQLGGIGLQLMDAVLGWSPPTTFQERKELLLNCVFNSGWCRTCVCCTGEGEARGVEGQVQQLLADAQDPEKLSKMYVGWAAWL